MCEQLLLRYMRGRERERLSLKQSKQWYRLTAAAQKPTSAIFFQNRRRSQGYPLHHPFKSFHYTTLAYILLAYPRHSPFPSCIKGGLPGVWPQNRESLTQELFTRGAACLFAHRSLVCKGGLWLHSKNRKIWVFFSQVFWKESRGRTNRKEFQWVLSTELD